MRSLSAIVTVLLFFAAMQASADEIVVVKWDKGKTQGVAAFDLAKHAVLWEAMPCAHSNFGERTSVGVLVGCDGSKIILLDTATGKPLWRRDVAIIEPDEYKRQSRPFREAKINRFHAERPSGFLVSYSHEVFFLIGKKGEYLMRCDNQGCTNTPKADREASAK